MSAVPKRKLTEAEYLTVERAALNKSEFYDGEMFAMAGASREHNTLKENLILELGMRIRSRGCRTYSSDQRVRLTPTGMFVYPDIVAVCTTPEYAEADRDSLSNPHVIIEVLSPSTERYDRGFKFAQYQLQKTIREFVLVAQDGVRIERFVRQPNDSWLLTVFADPAGEFALDTIPVTIPMAAIYAGVDLPPPPVETGPRQI